MNNDKSGWFCRADLRADGNQQPRPISRAAKGGKVGGAARLMGAAADYAGGLRAEGAGRAPEQGQKGQRRSRGEGLTSRAAQDC